MGGPKPDARLSVIHGSSRRLLMSIAMSQATRIAVLSTWTTVALLWVAASEGADPAHPLTLSTSARGGGQKRIEFPEPSYKLEILLKARRKEYSEEEFDEEDLARWRSCLRDFREAIRQKMNRSFGPS